MTCVYRWRRRCGSFEALPQAMQTDKTEVDRSNEVLAAPARVIATGGCLGFGGKFGGFRFCPCLRYALFGFDLDAIQIAFGFQFLLFGNGFLFDGGVEGFRKMEVGDLELINDQTVTFHPLL